MWCLCWSYPFAVFVIVSCERIVEGAFSGRDFFPFLANSGGGKVREAGVGGIGIGVREWGWGRWYNVSVMCMFWVTVCLVLFMEIEGYSLAGECRPFSAAQGHAFSKKSCEWFPLFCIPPWGLISPQ